MTKEAKDTWEYIQEWKTKFGRYPKDADELASCIDFVIARKQNSLPEGLDEAAIQAAQSDMQDRQIMEASNDERMRYSRIFRRGFKAGASWMAGQGVTMQITDNTQWEEVDRFIHRNCDGASVIQIRKK